MYAFVAVYLEAFPYCLRQIFHGLRLFGSLCLLYMPNFPGPTFIWGPTFIPKLILCPTLMQTIELKLVHLSLH